MRPSVSHNHKHNIKDDLLNILRQKAYLSFILYLFQVKKSYNDDENGGILYIRSHIYDIVVGE